MLIGVEDPPVPLAEAFTSDAQLVVSALDDLLGEPLFPVYQGDGELDPHIVALDATGAAIAVELIEQLDAVGLLRALDHAGTVSRMSRGALAAHYPGGLEHFHHDLKRYLDSVPYRRPKSGGDGSRLVIVCADAAEGVWNAVNFLNRPELPIKILRASSLQAIDGRSFVDVSPLVVAPGSSQPGLAAGARAQTSSPITQPHPVVQPRSETKSQPVAVVQTPPNPHPGAKVQTTEAPARLLTRAERKRLELERAGAGTSESVPVTPVTAAAQSENPETTSSPGAVGLAPFVAGGRRPDTKAAVDRARTVLAAADRILAVGRQTAAQPVVPVVESEPITPQSSSRLGRRQLREQGELGVVPMEAVPATSAAHLAGTTAHAADPHHHHKHLKPVEVEVEVMGVFARGTEPTDYLSWDTTTLPVIARAKRNPVVPVPAE